MTDWELDLNLERNWEVESDLQPGDDRTTSTAADARRRSLVVAAYEIIAEKGLEGLRTRDVAARVGVNIATLHYYFATKEALIRGVAGYLVHQFMTVHAPSSRIDNATPRERLRAQFVDAKYRYETMPQIQIVSYELFLRSLRDPSIRSIIAELDSAWRSYLTSFLEEGIRQGAFRPDLDPDLAASIIMITIKGAGIQFGANPDAFDFDRVCAEIEQSILL